MTFGMCGNGLRSTASDQLSSSLSAFRAQINDPVCFGNQIQLMFDYDHCMASVDQSGKDLCQAHDIYMVKPDGGFFQDEEFLCPGRSQTVSVRFEPAQEVGDQFESLGFTTAEGRTGLS